MKTKYVLSRAGGLCGLVVAAVLQSHAPRSSAADAPAPTASPTPKPQGYLLEFRAGHFPNLGADITYEIGDGNPRLELRSLTLDGDEVSGLSTQYNDAHGNYPRALLSTNRPIQKELVADVVEMDGTRVQLKLNIGQVIQPSEYLEGGRLMVIVRPGTVVVQSATHERCRIGTRTDWCTRGMDAAHVWERPPSGDPRYVGKISFYASQTMRPADYAVVLAKNPPTPEVEVAVSPANPPGPLLGGRCLKEADFSLMLNGQPVSLKLVPPLVGAPGHQCARYTLSQPISPADNLQLTVRQDKKERVYAGFAPQLKVSSSGAGVTFYVPFEEQAPVQVAQTPRFLRSSTKGVLSWRADLPWEPQLGRSVGDLQQTSSRTLP